MNGRLIFGDAVAREIQTAQNKLSVAVVDLLLLAHQHLGLVFDHSIEPASGLRQFSHGDRIRKYEEGDQIHADHVVSRIYAALPGGGKKQRGGFKIQLSGFGIILF